MYDTIIIGAGIAGMTAAIYASRKRMKYEIIAAEDSSRARFAAQTRICRDADARFGYGLSG